MIACEMVHHTVCPFIFKGGNTDVLVVMHYERGPISFAVSPSVRLNGV
jgi:hypothetical protein